MNSDNTRQAIFINCLIVITFLFTIGYLFKKLRLYTLMRDKSKYLTNITIIPQAKLRICILTIENRNLDYISISDNSITKYAKLHGYKYISLKSYKSDLPVYWWKIQYMQEILHLYDYVLWLDSDTLITNPVIPLEYLINMSNSDIYIGKSCLMSTQYFSPIYHLCSYFAPYCAGVFIIKNSLCGHNFLKHCIYTYKNNPKCIVDGKYCLTGRWAGECYEQGVMNTLLIDSYKDFTFTAPTSFVLNTYEPNFKSVILHKFSNKCKTDEYFKFYIENHLLKKVI
jgi:hypothetical protein